MRAGVLGVHRRFDERSPGGIALGRVASVPVAIADRGDRPPESVVILGVEDGDDGVVHRLGHGGEQSGILRDIAPGLIGDRSHDAVVDRRQRRFPETRDFRLFRRAGRTILRAERLHLVVVARPALAVERGRRARPELRRTRRAARACVAAIGARRESSSERRHPQQSPAGNSRGARRRRRHAAAMTSAAAFSPTAMPASLAAPSRSRRAPSDRRLRSRPSVTAPGSKAPLD